MNKQRISIMCQEDIYFIDLEKIIRCETVKNFTNIYFIDGTIKTLPCSIDKVEEKINNEAFFRTNDNHLINMNYMKFIKKHEDEIEMINGQEVPVSKNNKEELLKFLRLETVFLG
jgi:DNA-binding LytR/AlgR family response regulator